MIEAKVKSDIADTLKDLHATIMQLEKTLQIVEENYHKVSNIYDLEILETYLLIAGMDLDENNDTIHNLIIVGILEKYKN